MNGNLMPKQGIEGDEETTKSNPLYRGIESGTALKFLGRCVAGKESKCRYTYLFIADLNLVVF